MKSEILKSTFGNQKRWVNWKLEKVGDKMTKIPYSPFGGKAASDNPKTWATFDEALAKSENIGIMFGVKGHLLGIDIDKCVKNGEIVHEEKEAIEKFIKEADTYCELSPSKTGLHLFIYVEDGIDLVANKHAPYELYSKKRYFTVTGMPFGEEKEVLVTNRDRAEELLKIVSYPWGKTVSEIKNEAMVKFLTKPHSMEDSVLLEKIFSSRNGKKVKALYDGDTSDYKKDDSSADMALLNYLAFWTGRDAIQMERIWMSSPLGQRGKTQQRKDYRDRTIAEAIKNCKEVYEEPKKRVKREVEAIATKSEVGIHSEKDANKPEEVEEFKFEDLDLLYHYNAKKDIVYTQCTENICRVLERHPYFKGRFRYDAFRNLFEIRPHATNQWRPLEDSDAVKIQTAIQVKLPIFQKVGKDMVYDALIQTLKEHTYDSASDFIKGLTWDGEKRIDAWLCKTYGVEDTEYHRAVGSNWLKGLVKRIIEPGCKFDYVLVLEGEQGSKKSTSLSTLGGSWHVETTMSTDNKDFFMQFQGKAIIEFSEGETLSRTEVKRMKAIITMQTDKYRPPYERVSQEFPRRCVFAMTTNQEEYLKDETGNRRWLPVAVKFPEADIEWLEKNRDQLFAEAYQRVIVDKEKIYEFPKEETLREQAARQIKDSNTDTVIDWYFNKLNEQQRRDGITIFQVFRDIFSGGYNTRHIEKREEMAIGNILRGTLNLEKRRRRIGTAQVTRWFPVGSPEVEFGTEQPADELENFVKDFHSQGEIKF